MNKQELKAKLTNHINLKGNYNDYPIGSRRRLNAVGIFEGICVALELIEQLEEPELPVIPQFVADWIEEAKETRWGILNLFDSDQFPNEKIDNWLTNAINGPENSELAARAWLDGYTVEKEPDKLYEVKLPTENAMGNTMNLVQGGSKNRVWFDSLDDRIVKFKFTEKEIKSIDERYWAFAEPIEDEK